MPAGLTVAAMAEREKIMGTRSGVAVMAIAGLLIAGHVAAQNAPRQNLGVAVPGPAPAPNSVVVLPQIPGVVPWAAFLETREVIKERRMVPQFSAQLLALDRKSIKMHGFIIPLEAKALQTHFLLASQSSDCKFCLEGGPKTYVEVIAKEGVRASWEPVTISGKLELLRNDPSGVFYRLIDAKALRADGRSKSGT